TIDKARAEGLEMLARYGQQLALRFVEVLAGGSLADSHRAGIALAQQRMLALAQALVKRAEERARRTWDQRYRWAAADGRQMRQHHLTGLRRYLQVLAGERREGVGSLFAVPPGPRWGLARWLQAENDAAEMAGKRGEWTARLDGLFSRSAWRDLE